MSVRWLGPMSLINPSIMPEGTLVLLGASDSKKGFKVIGAVFSPSQDSLVADILADGGIFFDGGGEYTPFENEVIHDNSSESSP